MNIDDILKGLGDYNSTADQYVTRIANALIPIGLTLIAIFFFIEWLEWYKRLNSDEGGFTISMFFNIATKYIITFLLVMMSKEILTTILWFNIQVAKWANSISTNTGLDFGQIWNDPPSGFIQKVIFWLFATIAQFVVWIAGVITQALIMLRFIQLYIYKAVAPVVIPSYLSEEFHSTAVSFLKSFVAVAFQCVVIVIIAGLFPALIKGIHLDFNTAGTGGAKGLLDAVTAPFTAMVLAFIYILTLIGSQRTAKSMIGAN